MVRKRVGGTSSGAEALLVCLRHFQYAGNVRAALLVGWKRPRGTSGRMKLGLRHFRWAGRGLEALEEGRKRVGGTSGGPEVSRRHL